MNFKTKTLFRPGPPFYGEPSHRSRRKQDAVDT